MNSENRRKELIASEFNFQEIRSVEINWSDSLDSEPQLHDCSFDDAMVGLDIYVLCLHNGVFSDENSLLFYNNPSNTDDGIVGDYNTCYAHFPGWDQYFLLNPKKLADSYDEILFFIGRPKSRNSNSANWIDQNLVKEVSYSKCYVNCLIKNDFDEHISLKNIEYDYNKNGALVLFSFKCNNEKWDLDLSQNFYFNGLNEILEKHYRKSAGSC